MNFLTAKETKNTYIEEKFFEKHKKSMEYRSRIVLGSLIDPNQVPNWLARILWSLGQMIDFDGI